MDLDDVNFTPERKLLPPAPEIREPWRGRVIYLYDPKTGTTIRKPYGPNAHLGATEDS